MSFETVVKGGKGICAPTFDGDKRLYVVGQADGRLYVEEEGHLVEIATTGGSPSGLAIDHLNAIYVCDQAHAAILLVKEDGQAQVVVGEYEGKAFKGPHSATIDSAGQLFFTDSGPFGETSLLEPQGSVFVVTGEANNRILRPLAYERLACPTGIALSPEESCVYVAEMAANRILRFVQRPANVWHATVFHQFSGRMGPTAVCCDSGRGLIYVARYELPEFAERGVISVLSPEGQLLKDLDVPGPEVTGLALSQDGSYLLVTEATTNAVHKLLL